MKLLKPSRRLFIAQALAAPALITSPRAVEAFWQSRDSNYNKSVGGAPASSGWDPAGKGTDISLSTTTVANDTATTSSGSFETVRGTASHTTGKWAFEIKIINAVELMFGLLDQTTAGGAGLVGFTIADGFAQWGNNNFFPTGADFSGGSAGGFAVANGDIFGLQADLTAGKVWFSQNGVSISGDPVAGTGNTASIANNHLVCPSAAIITNGSSVQLVTGTLTNPVSGYTSWG